MYVQTKNWLAVNARFNRFKTNEMSHFYQLDQSISVLRVIECVFSLTFIQILLEHSVSKQWRSWSDTALCGVWSGSALFAYVK